MPSNSKRAHWADKALTSFQVETRCDREDALANLLCDFMHLASREGWNFAQALRRAEDHFRDEVTNPETEALAMPIFRRSVRAP